MSLRKVLLIGVPGSGKGTQAQRLVPYGLKHISTGELIRKAWQEGDSLVMSYWDSIQRGHFLPDNEVFALIDRELAKIKGAKGYVLDGAIRNVAQADMAMHRNLLEDVLYFDLKKEAAVKRLNARGREDDTPESIERRFAEYKAQTETALFHLARNGFGAHVIDASQSKDKVHEKILDVLRLR